MESMSQMPPTDTMVCLQTYNARNRVSIPWDHCCLAQTKFIMNIKSFLHPTFHLSCCLLYGLAIYYYEIVLTIPPRKPQGKFAGHLKFLTYWNVILQFVVFGLCFISDVIPKNSVKEKLDKYKDIIFTSLALPIGNFVVAVFWVLYLIDRELILPRALDAFYPAWLNHVSHTTIFPLLLTEIWLCHHPHPSRKIGMATLISFVAVYLTWVVSLSIALDFWVYPILEVLNWSLRVAFFIGCGIIMVLFYLLGESLNSTVWRSYAGNDKRKMK
ncbi:androgen-induced gene 1 protein-like [Tachypleus tridentatus]|uniref:androgen-induced gene 1 protein-like n=1 Tax=Tachypleus tridentatus TaxID=6853 RepID=UPI003FD28B37